MTPKRTAGIVLAIAFTAAFIAWNIWLSKQPDANLLVRAFGAVPLGGGAVLSWMFLVRDRRSEKD